MSPNTTVAIIGAGNEGQAAAADLSLRGFKVRLYNRTLARIEPIILNGGIHARGCIEGFAKLDAVSASVEEVVAGSEIILVTTVASAHRDIAALVGPYLRSGQIVILSPGRTFGVLEFSTVLQERGFEKRIGLIETQSSPYISRAMGDGSVLIKSLKNELSLAVFPISDRAWVEDRLSRLFPQSRVEPHALTTGLGNIGAVIHPATLLLNWSRIEGLSGPLYFYQEAITPSVARVIESIDTERLSIANALGVEVPSLLTWLQRSYGVTEGTILQAFRQNLGYEGLETPKSLGHRYVQEDVPTGLIPLSSLGKALNLATPTIDMIIHLAEVYTGEDFRLNGRTVENLGIAGLSPEKILELFMVGWSCSRLALTSC